MIVGAEVYSRGVLVVVVLALAACFGAGDQYLGSLSAHPWAAALSLLSAPWLAVAFVAGATQRRPGKAALLGLACTLAALTGYGLMALSPIEHAHLTAQSVRGFLFSEHRIVAGAFMTGPLFGWLGNRWRTRRSWSGLLALAAALSLEPLAHQAAGNAIRIDSVSFAEAAAGIALALYAAASAIAARAAT